MITMPLKELYQDRTSNVKSVSDGLTCNIALVNGGWQEEFAATISASFTDLNLLSRYGCAAKNERGLTNSAEAVDYTLHLLSERVVRALPIHLEYPNKAAPCLDSDSDRRREARAAVLSDAEVIWGNEKSVAEGDRPEVSVVMDDITWKDTPGNRVMLNLCDEERNTAEAPRFTSVAEGLILRLLDEKAPEDIHQTIRDIGRGRRHKNMSMKTIYSAAINSGIIPKRGLKHAAVSKARLARSSWTAVMGKEKTSMTFKPQPQDWPNWLNGILNPRRPWPSPAVPTHANSYIAWEWLCTWTRVFKTVGRVGPLESWRSRLVPKYQVVHDVGTGEVWVSLFSGNWGCISVKADTVAESTWSISLSQQPIVVRHVLAHTAIIITPIRGCFRQGYGLLLQQAGDQYPLYESALWRRHDFTHWELTRACADVDPNTSAADLDRCQKGDLVTRLIVWCLGQLPNDMAKVIEIYATDPVEDDPIDPHMVELLEDLAVTDQVNSSDLKAWKMICINVLSTVLINSVPSFARNVRRS